MGFDVCVLYIVEMKQKILPIKQWCYIDEVDGDFDLIESHARPYDATAVCIPTTEGKAYLCTNVEKATLFGRLAAIKGVRIKRP